MIYFFNCHEKYEKNNVMVDKNPPEILDKCVRNRVEVVSFNLGLKTRRSQKINQSTKNSCHMSSDSTYHLEEFFLPYSRKA